MEDEEILNELVVEAQEHLDTIEPILMGWGKDLASADHDSVNRVFRSLHTIKGGFGFFGLANIKNLSHVMETLLMQIRDGEKDLASGMIEVLLDGVDRLRALVDDVAGSDRVVIEGILERLLPLTDNAVEVAANPDLPGTTMIRHGEVGLDGGLEPSSAHWAEADRLGHDLLRLRLHAEVDLASKQRTPYDVVSGLSDFGEIVDSHLGSDAITGLDDALDVELVYQFLYQTMAPSDMVAEVLDIPMDQVEVLDHPGTTAQVSEALEPKVQASEDLALPLDDSPTPTAAPAQEPAAPTAAPAPVKAPSASSGSSTAQDGKGKEPAAKAEEMLRLPVSIVDRLMTLAGELVLSRNQLRMISGSRLNTGNIGKRITESLDLAFGHFLERIQDDSEVRSTVAEPLNLLRKELLDEFGFTLDEMPDIRNMVKEVDSVATEMQDAIMQTRLQPVGRVFNKTPRLVRQLAKDLGKEIQLEISGEGTELDKSVIEAIADPLTHLLRNSCDHGIEGPDEREAAGKTRHGTIFLSASHESGMVVLRIADDGGGVNEERVLSKAVERGFVRQEDADSMTSKSICELIFHPGFSTAAVISDVSGRGVGMDVVRINIECLGGSIELQSEQGVGASFTIRIPLTLAIVPALLVTSGERPFALPQTQLLELLRIKHGDPKERTEHVGNRVLYRLRGELLPLLFLEEILHPERVGESSDRQSEYWQVAVVAADGNRFGIVVDNVIDTVDIVIKRLSHALADLQVYAGATILGDGEVALIIDPAGLVRQAGLLGGGGLKKEELEDLRLEDAEKLGSDGRREDLVLVENSDGGRITLPLEDVIRLDKITAMDQQVAGGQVMANYRGQVMPLIWVSEVLPERRVGERAIRVDRDDPQQRVVVVNHRDKPLGLVVHRLLDIGAEVITGERPGSRKGVASCGLIRDKVTEFLDVAEVFELANLDGSLTNLTSSQPVEDPAANSPEGDPA